MEIDVRVTSASFKISATGRLGGVLKRLAESKWVSNAALSRLSRLTLPAVLHILSVQGNRYRSVCEPFPPNILVGH